MSLCIRRCLCVPEEGVESLGAGVTGGHGPPDVWVRNQTLVLCRKEQRGPLSQAISSAPNFLCFKPLDLCPFILPWWCHTVHIMWTVMNAIQLCRLSPRGSHSIAINHFLTLTHTHSLVLKAESSQAWWYTPASLWPGNRAATCLRCNANLCLPNKFEGSHW